MQALFDAIRAECPRGLWAQGVRLARDGAVLSQERSEAEWVLRVRGDGATAATVVLYPSDLEWDCDCGSRFAACAHVAAAIITVQNAGKEQQPVPTLRAAGLDIEYRFRRHGDALELERLLGGEPIVTALTGRADLQPNATDLEVDALVRGAGGRPLSHDRLAAILAALDGASGVTFEGVPIHTSGDPVLPLARVRDHEDGVLLEVIPDPGVSEVVGSGIARTGDILAPLGHTAITGEQLERLPLRKQVPPAGYAELVTETLPSLELDIPVEIETLRLPETTVAARPRIDFELGFGDPMTVLPRLEYGVPPIARIEGDRMIHLRGPAPLRDRPAERVLLHRLRDQLNLVPGRRVEYHGNDAMRIAEKLRAWRGEGYGPAAPDYVLSQPLVPRLEIDGNLSLSFESDQPGTARRTASAAAVLGAWQSGLELVALDGGGWAPLPAEWLAAHGDRVADLLAARGDAATLPRHALPELAALADDLGLPRPPITETVAALLEEFTAIPEAALPAGFTGTLRSYQQSGVSWLIYLREAGLGALLADDMGLGKTVQALAAITGRTLVVCPTSVLATWAAETARFRPDLRVSLYHGPGRALDPDADVTLTSYALLRLDARTLGQVNWDTAVLDEAQMIKNPHSQVARAAHRLRAGFRMVLTGTPIENRLDELWSLLQFTNPGLLGERPRFQRRYARPIARGDGDAARRLRARIRPFLLRRRKAEVTPELPPRTTTTLLVELDPEERALYDAIRATTRADVVAKLRAGGNLMAALEALLRLRQASCHRALVPGQHADSSAKLAELLSRLDLTVASGHKALVFSQWTSLLDLVEPHLHAAGIDFTRLDGSTRDRGAVVERFQGADGPPVLLVSLKAGGTGLTLTAADHVFLLDPWWNPAVEDQAADRTHRIGQERPVSIYRLVAADTVETRILALQEQKRALVAAALEGAEGAAGLTREDLLALLE